MTRAGYVSTLAEEGLGSLRCYGSIIRMAAAALPSSGTLTATLHLWNIIWARKAASNVAVMMPRTTGSCCTV